MQVEAIAGIYQITNTANGRQYIGQSKDVLKRIGQHTRMIRKQDHHNRLLREDSIEHGPQVFKVEVAEIVAETARLLERETAWIDQLKPAYNLDDRTAVLTKPNPLQFVVKTSPNNLMTFALAALSYMISSDNEMAKSAFCFAFADGKALRKYAGLGHSQVQISGDALMAIVEGYYKSQGRGRDIRNAYLEGIDSAAYEAGEKAGFDMFFSVLENHAIPKLKQSLEAADPLEATQQLLRAWELGVQNQKND